MTSKRQQSPGPPIYVSTLSSSTNIQSHLADMNSIQMMGCIKALKRGLLGGKNKG